MKRTIVVSVICLSVCALFVGIHLCLYGNPLKDAIKVGDVFIIHGDTRVLLIDGDDFTLYDGTKVRVVKKNEAGVLFEIESDLIGGTGLYFIHTWAFMRQVEVKDRAYQILDRSVDHSADRVIAMENKWDKYKEERRERKIKEMQKLAKGLSLPKDAQVSAEEKRIDEFYENSAPTEPSGPGPVDTSDDDVPDGGTAVLAR